MSGEASAGAPATDTLLGQQVGPYRILSPLGQGGMGSVYLAEHELIGRKAAIKVLNPEIAGDYEAVSRFFLEARTVSQIRHPNIVDVTDFGHHRGQPYIVMEYLEGETLADRCKRCGALDSLTVLKIARQVASALGAVHEHGLIHRDLKPANIFLCAHPDYPDFIKVLDFGIAKLTRDAGDVGHQTRAGALLGTPQYMSPEQCLGERDIDARSDVYALGVVLYVMLTGALPFSNRPLGQLIIAHVTETPRPPEALNPAIWPSLSAITCKALAKARGERWASMRQLREAMDEILSLMQPAQAGAPQAPMQGDSTGPLALAAAAFAEEGARRDALKARLVARAAATGEPAGEGPESASVTLTLSRAEPPAPDILVGRIVEFLDERLGADKVTLPALSRASGRCLELLRMPGYAFADLSDALAREPHLAHRIVAQSNRGAAEGGLRVTGIAPAIRRLGAEGLLRVLIELATFSVYTPAGASRIPEVYRSPWQHAIAVGFAAERLASLQALAALREFSGALYVAGVMLPMGRVVLGDFLLHSERRLAVRQGIPRIPREALLSAAERRAQAVSARVARTWKLPDAVVSVIEQSRAEPAAPDGRVVQVAAPIVLRLAAAIVAGSGFALRSEDAPGAEDEARACLARLGLGREVAARLGAELDEQVPRLARARAI